MPRGEFASSELNRQAGEYLRRARESLQKTLPDFAAEIAHATGTSGSTSQALSQWERGERTVPAAVILAAARLSGLPLEDPAAERTLSQRLQRLEEGQERVEEGLLEIRRELATRQARLIGSPESPLGAP